MKVPQNRLVATKKCFFEDMICMPSLGPRFYSYTSMECLCPFVCEICAIIKILNIITYSRRLTLVLIDFTGMVS